MYTVPPPPLILGRQETAAATVKASEKIAARRQAFPAALPAARGPAAPRGPGRSKKPPPPAEPPLAITLLHAWEQAIATGDDEAADFAIARLKTLAQPPDPARGVPPGEPSRDE
jgi:hypothetical protein